MTEHRQITAQWLFILGEGRVVIKGLTEEPLMLTSTESRNLGGMAQYADMADAAEKILIWLLESGIEEAKAVEMITDFCKRAQDEETMSGLLKAFGRGF